ncbi:sporulation protein YpjB [Mesobacillus maritimus]|uniref:sporulation protein YpjB n=1 Tax=Mesobacillus maritimus TaxID=1643336 RepID=UPI00203D3A3A|nr:sporulation protein YpjB [Mesobacillus maritimus]MCM3586518.1 sporulation protein YpjB [Mesobacillus maritimus]
MKPRKGILLFLTLLLLLVPVVANAAIEPSIKKLDDISDQALQMVKVYRYEDAEKLLTHFETEFLKETAKGHMYSMDELRIVTTAHDEALKAMNSSTMAHEEKIHKVTRFRLVVDALQSIHQPLWTEMESPIMTVFNDMKDAVHNGNHEDFQVNLDSFLSLYEVIYPSLRVDVTPATIQQLNARVNYLDHYSPNMFTETTGQEELEALEADLKKLFDDMTEDESDPSLWWVIISTGSIIIMTLSYVGWKKYRAEIERRKNRLKERKN